MKGNQMKTEHTPGPWAVRNINYGEFRSVGTIQAANGLKVVEPGGIWGASLPECDANASLVAAAPDLLAACKESLDLLRDMSMGNHRVALNLEASIATAMGQ